MDFNPLVLSLEVATFATFFALVLGLFAARLVTKLKRGKFLWDSVLMLPLVLPPTVTGFFLLILFGKNSALGKILSTIGLQVIFTLKGAVIAACIVSFPIIYRGIRGAFENLDPELVDVARLYGCNEFMIFFRVYVPLCWQELRAVTIIAFARAIGEFGATIMVAGNIPGKTRTMSIAIYTSMQSGDRQEAYRWVAITLALSFIVLMITNCFSGIQYSHENGKGNLIERWIRKKDRLSEDLSDGQM